MLKVEGRVTSHSQILLVMLEVPWKFLSWFEVADFPEDAQVITAFLERLLERGYILSHRIKSRRAIVVRVAPGHQTFATGLANRHRDVGLHQAHSFAGEPIQIWCDVWRFAARKSGRIVVHVVRRNKENVKFARGFCRTAKGGDTGRENNDQ